MGRLTDIQDTEIVELIASGIESAACFSTLVMWENEPRCGGCGCCSTCDTTYLDLQVEFHYDGRKRAKEAARAALLAIFEEAGVETLEELREDRDDSGEFDDDECGALYDNEFWHDFGMCLWYTREGHGCGFFDDPSKWDVVGGESFCRKVGKRLSVDSDHYADLWPGVRALEDGDYEVMDSVPSNARVPEAGE